jgi:hypothetical protein
MASMASMASMAAFGKHLHRPFLAGRLRSPRAASEQSSSQNLDLADWPVWRKLTDGLGSVAAIGLDNLSGCSQSDPVVGARPQW